MWVVLAGVGPNQRKLIRRFSAPLTFSGQAIVTYRS
jgi:hypothetical protein